MEFKYKAEINKNTQELNLAISEFFTEDKDTKKFINQNFHHSHYLLQYHNSYKYYFLKNFLIYIFIDFFINFILFCIYYS